MIERMKRITVFCQKEKALSVVLSLRELGLVHIKDMAQKSVESENKERDKSIVLKALGNLESYVDKKNPLPEKTLTQEDVLLTSKSIVSLMEEEQKTVDRVRVLRNEADRIRSWGDFDPNEIKELSKMGINLHFYLVTKKDLKALSEDSSVTFVNVKNENGSAVAVIGDPLKKDYQLSEFTLPSKSLGELESEALIGEKRVEEIREIFRSSTSYISSLNLWLKNEEEVILLDKVNATVSDDEGISYITGYVPLSSMDSFKSWAKENSVGYISDDPGEDENPPTKLNHKGFVRIIQPLFDMLGLVPGYREKDISRYFLMFMTLFFAMIIGDAGYGLLLVLLAAALNIKSKKCSDLNALIYVFGGATVVWGAITGTWFGSQTIIENVGFLRMLVIPGLTNFPEAFSMNSINVQDNMMTLCFSIGTIHLSLACVICIFDKIKQKDLSFIADFGWMLNTNLLYLLVLYLVVDTPVPFTLIVVGIIIGFVLVCLFSEMAPDKPFGQGMKESLGGFFTNFIDTISCFSNVMSYIRLFAVGLASLAIAQSFNGMAEGLLSGFALPFGILVLIIGHAVNLVMGFLSIVVHGVRLNIMEFSGQVGVEWSGYKYEPFKKKVLK